MDGVKTLTYERFLDGVKILTYERFLFLKLEVTRDLSI